MILMCSLHPQNSSSFQGCCAVQEPDIFLLLLFFLEFMVQFWLRMITFQWFANTFGSLKLDILCRSVDYFFVSWKYNFQTQRHMQQNVFEILRGVAWLCESRWSRGHLPWVCHVQSFCFVSWVSCTSVAVGGAAEMSLEHAKWGLQAGVVMLLLLTLLGEEVLPLGAAPGAALIAPPPVQRTELWYKLSPTLPPALSSLQTDFSLCFPRTLLLNSLHRCLICVTLPFPSPSLSLLNAHLF